MTEQGGARALGSSNFAILTRDYLNLNTRLDFHFAMIDTVCGPNARENYIRFRFKGGGTTEVQRERRARFISMVLKSEEFSTDVKGDLVTASLAGTGQESAARKLIALGRLLGFSRLLDASMRDDDAPARLAKAFFDEDWALERFS
jgi:pyruvate,water dikinase